MDPLDIHDNADLRRYEAEIGGLTAYVRYRRSPGVVTFIHTEVPEGLAGRGIGSALALHVLEVARINGLKVVAVCPFIAAWMKKHPEYDDLTVSAGTPADDG